MFVSFSPRYLFPPYYQTLSNHQIYEWATEERFKMKPAAIECTQRAGDLMFIPHGWTHGVLNTKTTVALAMETDSGSWQWRPM